MALAGKKLPAPPKYIPKSNTVMNYNPGGGGYAPGGVRYGTQVGKPYIAPKPAGGGGGGGGGGQGVYSGGISDPSILFDPTIIYNPANDPELVPDGQGGWTVRGQPRRPTDDELENDPRIRALRARKQGALEDFRNANLREKRRILLGFGSKALAQEILPGDPELAGVTDDPRFVDSWLSRRNAKLGREMTDLEGRLIDFNTFAGGGRAFGTDLVNRGYNEEVGTERGNVRAALGGLPTESALTADWDTIIENAKRDIFNAFLAGL